MARWRALVQDIGGVVQVGEADTHEEALALARQHGGSCFWAMPVDREIPDVEPKKPWGGSSWRGNNYQTGRRRRRETDDA